MLHGILEQHQPHLSTLSIVLSKALSQYLAKSFWLGNLRILTVSHTLGKIGENIYLLLLWLCKYLIHININGG